MNYKQWTIPAEVMQQTEAAMQRGAHEVFVMWSANLPETGGETGEVATIRRCIVPAQEPGETPDGVFVHIEGKELQRIQLDNYRRQEWNVVQLHTHPGHDVRMSQLDREWEAVRHPGALSIIVPWYCSRGLNRFAGANIYERERDDWRLWTVEEVRERLVMP
jgi:proteasome lid subunit RPN8/RPN11